MSGRGRFVRRDLEHLDALILSEDARTENAAHHVAVQRGGFGVFDVLLRIPERLGDPLRSGDAVDEPETTGRLRNIGAEISSAKRCNSSRRANSQSLRQIRVNMGARERSDPWRWLA